MRLKKGDYVFICTDEHLNEKYVEANEMSNKDIKSKVLNDVYTYTKKHKITNIKPISKYVHITENSNGFNVKELRDHEEGFSTTSTTNFADVQKQIVGAKITFADVED